MTIFDQLITPAAVSLVVSLIANRRMEAKRARRDHITKLFEGAREEVRRGCDAAIDYYSVFPDDRTALQEAKVVAADKEARATLPLLLESIEPLRCEALAAQTKNAFYTYLSELTGGDFQSSGTLIDREHTRRLVLSAAQLRSGLMLLRDAQLKALIDDDLFFPGIGWIAANNPFRSRSQKIR